MLVDFLQDIYEKAMTLELIREASFYSSIRHLFNRRDYWNEASAYLEKIILDLKETDLKKAAELMDGSFKAKASYDDWHNFSATIDTEVVPKVQEYLKRNMGINVTEGDWTLESSQTGFLTIKNNKGLYLHSPADPMWESFLYAYSIFDPGAGAYYILGAGLGYLAYQLWKMSDKEADIYVFEIDKEVSEYADLYGVLSYIDEDNLHVVTGDDTDIILEKYAENIPGVKTVRTMFYWDINKYKGEYAEFFRIEFSNEVTSRLFEYKWRNNYENNIRAEHKMFTDLDPTSYSDEWVVVGSGPSLNYNEDFIRESLGKRTICAVNSSLKWFSIHGIKPDMCTVCDPTDLLVPHIEGIEEFSADIPIVADCVANSKYMDLYKGPKYYIYSTAALLTLGRENVHGDVWGIGGTVTSLAISVAFELGAKKIYLIGADLGYPDGDTFAEGVGHDVGKWKNTEGTVISVDDKLIPTSIKFREYKCMIEKQIEKYPNVEVFNRSLYGAYLKGTFCGKWWEKLPESDDIEDYIPLFEELKKDSLILDWKQKFYIFWQLLEKGSSCKLGQGLTGHPAVTEAYKSIYDAFKVEMGPVPVSGGRINKGQTYIFTDEFTDIKDDTSKRIIDIAQAEDRNNKNVLIVNTAERLGGEKVSVYDPVDARVNSDMEKNEKIFCGNRTFSYFQFGKGMPDAKYFSVFLESVSGNRPGKLIIACKFSLLADYCSEVLGIPTEKKI